MLLVHDQWYFFPRARLWYVRSCAGLVEIPRIVDILQSHRRCSRTRVSLSSSLPAWRSFLRNNMSVRLGRRKVGTSCYRCANCVPSHHRQNTSYDSPSPPTDMCACCVRIRRTQSTSDQSSVVSLADMCACCVRIHHTQSTCACWEESLRDLSRSGSPPV